MKKGGVYVLLLFLLILGAGIDAARAADMPTNEELFKEIKELKIIVQKQNEKIDNLEKQVCGQQEIINKNSEVLKKEKNQDISVKLRHELDSMNTVGGFDIGVETTFVGQGTVNANNAAAPDSEDSRFDGSYSLDLTMAKTFDDYGMAFVHMEAAQGNTIESELSVFSNVNRDAGESNAHVDVTEAWYEQYLSQDQVTITGGKIGADTYIDTNEYANDENTQFLGHIFRNSSVIDFPDDNALGGRICLSPGSVSFIDVEAIYMDENGDWENLFDNPFIATQLNFKPAKAFGYDEEVWGGNYRTYFWYNGAPHPTVKNADEIERGNIGFGLSCDQMITDTYGIFGRFGWADPEKNDLEYDWSVGAQMSGKYWMREEDVLAIAVGQAIPGKEYRDINEFDKAETHLEAYYSFKINDHLVLSPDVQMIWEPTGGGTTSGEATDAIFVYGIRGHMDL
ncbi:MAG: carbohydrate porin [Candidatus Aadella gelida]|nr:carbohydrate porin [Candidatus Aadella gelida]